ncbi:hypothetical protein [Salinispora arenicola]|nr:hypothetical protein [Salinispora arenicola]MCN0153049.1 hypothetical protein [Salinispora arenicola]
MTSTRVPRQAMAPAIGGREFPLRLIDASGLGSALSYAFCFTDWGSG